MGIFGWKKEVSSNNKLIGVRRSQFCANLNNKKSKHEWE